MLWVSFLCLKTCEDFERLDGPWSVFIEYANLFLRLQWATNLSSPFYPFSFHHSFLVIVTSVISLLNPIDLMCDV